MRILLLHNPAAGNGGWSRADLVRLLEAEGHAVLYRDAKAEPIDPAEAEAADLVAVAGGDGTVGQAVRALGPAAGCLLILPLGTANNIARCLRLPDSPAAIVRECAGAARRALDLGVARGPWGERLFLEGAGVGAIAELVAAGDAVDLSFRDKQRFALEAPAPFLRRAEHRRWRVAVDGVLLPEDLLFVEVLNMPVTGPGLPLGSGTWPGDRRLDVAYLRPENRAAFAGWLEHERTGPPAGLDIVQGERVTLLWPGGPLLIDDHFPDPAAAPAEVEFTLHPRQLQVLVPRRRRGE